MSEVKQVLVVRKDLKMRMGKVGAQCAHASMKVILDLMSKERFEVVARTYEAAEPHPKLTSNHKWSLQLEEGSPILSWLEGSFTKVTVYVTSEEELNVVYHEAQDAGLPCSLIVDSGRTEFHGVPTPTVVAVGPALSSDIDTITGHLPLL